MSSPTHQIIKGSTCVIEQKKEPSHLHCLLYLGALLLLSIFSTLCLSKAGNDIEQILVDSNTEVVVHTGFGDAHDVHIGLTLQQYEAGLKRQERDLETRFVRAQPNDRQHLKTQLHVIQGRLQDTKQSYREFIEDLTIRIAQLESIRGQVSDKLLNRTQRALADGDAQQVDQLLNQMESQTTLASQVTAEANYQRCQIAKHEIRFRQALTLCQLTVQLTPNRTDYISETADLAHALGEHEKAVEFYEQALTIDLKIHDEGHPNVAVNRNNLGAAWDALGEYKKAIAYYEQVLTSDLKIHGEDHPDVAIDRNNLGMAWYALGEYQKANDYLEQALAGFQKILGKNHPNTTGVRANYQQLLKIIQKQESGQ